MKRAMNPISTNDIARVMARELIRTIQTRLPPEDHQDAYDEFFVEFFYVCNRGLIGHDTLADKIYGRLKPSRN